MWIYCFCVKFEGKVLVIGNSYDLFQISDWCVGLHGVNKRVSCKGRKERHLKENHRKATHKERKCVKWFHEFKISRARE